MFPASASNFGSLVDQPQRRHDDPGRHIPAYKCTVPGEPVAQGRGESFILHGKGCAWHRTHKVCDRGCKNIRVRDPKKSRDWKAMASLHFTSAMAGRQPMNGAVHLSVEAVFSCPKGDWRKRTPRERRRHTKRPDIDNIAKAVLDAANGVILGDDCSVAVLTVEKWIGAQGELPYVCVTVEEIET